MLDEVGAEAPCVTDEPEAETLPSGEPSSSSHPSSSTPRVSGPSLPWIDVNDELEWPGGPPKYDLLTDLDQEALERTNPRRELVVCLWSPPWLTPPGVRYCKKTGANQLCC